MYNIIYYIILFLFIISGIYEYYFWNNKEKFSNNNNNNNNTITNYPLLLADNIWKQTQQLTNNAKDLNTILYNITDKFKILNTIMKTKQSDMLVFELSKHVGSELGDVNDKISNIIKKILDSNENLITIIYPNLS